MQRFIVLGVDTDAGKTTFSLLWLAAHPEWHYWKPLETGDSDTAKIRRLTPGTIVHEPIARFAHPLAPPLAARLEGCHIPASGEMVALLPAVDSLLIETFGSPFSPLNERDLQIEFIKKLKLPTILVSSSKLGAIGRSLAALSALRSAGVELVAVVLMGDADEYASEQIEKHGGIIVASLRMPADWTAEGIAASANEQPAALAKLEQLERYRPPRLDDKSNQLIERDRQYVWHPYTSLRNPDAPLAVIGAQDEFLHLADGRTIIDGTSSWWTILHGHRQPRLMKALADAMQSFDHILFAGVTHPPAVRVAELLLKTMPWNGGRVFFSDNGSTAVEVALKLAYQFWSHRGESQRQLFIGFDNSYHGDTFGAMAVGRDPLFFGRFEPLLFRAERVPVSANHLDETLKRNAGQVGAVILEPLVQGAGGMQMHTPEELRDIFEVTRRHNVLFIADEVMTGCFRTGTMWAHQAAGIAPDVICASKTLAGGILPLAVTLVSPDLVVAFDTDDRQRTFFHGHSFTAHPLACAIAAENLKWLQREPPTAPARFERFWKQSLAALHHHPKVKTVRIRGTIAAIELDSKDGYLSEVGRRLRATCLEHGAFLRPLGNVLYALPPFGTSEESLNQIARAIHAAVQSA